MSAEVCDISGIQTPADVTNRLFNTVVLKVISKG